MCRCKLCGSNSTHIEYEGVIRDGGLGKYTKVKVKMYTSYLQDNPELFESRLFCGGWSL